MEIWDLIVLGGGPAGLSAALVASNNGLQVVLVEASQRLGGQLYHADAPIVDVLGRHDLMGPELAEIYAEHLRATRAGATAVEVLLRTRVRELRLPLSAGERGLGGEGALSAFCEREALTPNPSPQRRGESELAAFALQGHRVLLATGVVPRRLNVSGAELANPVEDPRREHERFAGRRVVIVGGGDESASLARDLADVGVQVTLLVRSQLRARPLFAEPLSREPAVTVLPGVRVASFRGEVAGDGGDEVLREVILNTGERLAAAAAFVRIGWAPSLPEIEPAPERHANGRLVVDGEGRTSCPALYAVGDLVRPPAQRYITAALADGALAARAIETELAGAAG